MTTPRRVCLLALAMALLTSGPGLGQQGPETKSPLRLEALSATRERPLFSPSRRPPVVVKIEPQIAEPIVAVALQPAPPPPPPAVRLIGLLVMPHSRTAILEHEPTGEVIRLASGAELDSWTMTVIDPRTVAFENGERQLRYVLFDK